MQNHDLWLSIKQFELDNPRAELSFSGRLGRENGWSPDFAIRAIYEYKKFIFLICHYDQPLTPSDQVDQVWHLHLLYTKNYWIDFCQKTLKKQIHHQPTEGGRAEREKFAIWYEQTKLYYRDAFGQEPPADIWPDGKERFFDIDFQRVNLKKYWLIPKLW